jgi:hypothetical protein
MTPRRAVLSLAIIVSLVQSPTFADTSGPITPGFLPSNARVHGQGLTDLATAWVLWAFGSAAEVNPLLDGRCERSPVDPRIWFLPASLGGESESTCKVPPGTFLVITPGSLECSNLEPEPFYGADESELRVCADDGFDLLTYAEVTLDGTSVTNLDDYVLTTNLLTLPPNNLISPESGISIDKGYFLVIPPLSRGTHTLRLYDEFESFDFHAGITFTIVVG